MEEGVHYSTVQCSAEVHFYLSKPYISSTSQIGSIQLISFPHLLTRTHPNVAMPGAFNGVSYPPTSISTPCSNPPGLFPRLNSTPTSLPTPRLTAHLIIATHQRFGAPLPRARIEHWLRVTGRASAET